MAEHISEDDLKLLEAFHALHVKPKIESPDDLVSFMKHFGKEVEDPHGKGAIPKVPATIVTGHNFPRISTFYGEDGKGEVNWLTFKFEVDSLKIERIFSDEQILLGIRRAVKGNASDILRRFGTGVGIREVLDKLESTFGSIESEEIVMRKFYACQQDATESVVAYASRLEEIYARAVALGGVKKGNDKVLKRVLYQGLIPQIKQLAFNKCDLIDDYDIFKVEVRKIEADLTLEKDSKKKCHAAVNVDKEKSEMTEIKELLQKLNSRIDRLEQDKEERNTNQYDTYYRGNRAERRGSFRNRSQDQNRGYGGNRMRRGYQPTRQTGTNTMTPTCFQCGNKGHFARNCPN